MLPDEELAQVLAQVLAQQAEILAYLRRFQGTLDQYAHLLPKPNGLAARLLGR